MTVRPPRRTVALAGLWSGLRGRPRQRFPYWFVVPALAVYGLTVLYPTVAGGVYAFTDWTGGRPGAHFQGLANFRALLHDPDALASLKNTLLLAVVTTTAEAVIGLALALVLHSALPGRNVLRTVFFAPAVLPPVVIGYLWQYMLAPSGPVNQVLTAAGLEALTQNWIGDSKVALLSVIGVIVWQNSGLAMVIFLAGLEGIPEELLEASQMDGAGWWRRLASVRLPLLLPATTIVLSLTLISSLKLFDMAFVLTGGGPGYATQTLSLVMYREAFVNGHFGYGASIALVLTMLVVAFAMAQIGALRRLEVDR